MILADTHAHLYLDAFDGDRDAMLRRALDRGVSYFFLPNIDRDSIPAMLSMADQYPGHCFPMMGLHPTSVKADYKEHLAVAEEWLDNRPFAAVGEMGIDLYWDRTFLHEQQEAFRAQCRLALHHDLPVVIHSRNSFDEIFTLLEEEPRPGLRGVFHCFSGNAGQARRITDMGFMLGIGGVLTYKKSGLDQAIKDIPVECLLLETDAPFLPPVPYRGQRNESAYILEIAARLAEVKGLPLDALAHITTENALRLFRLSTY